MLKKFKEGTQFHTVDQHISKDGVGRTRFDNDLLIS